MLNIQEVHKLASGRQNGPTKRTIDDYLADLKRSGAVSLPNDQLHWLVDMFAEEVMRGCRSGFAHRVMRQLEAWASKSDDRLLTHFRRVIESAGDVDPVQDDAEQVPWGHFMVAHCVTQGAQGVAPYPSQLWQRLHALTSKSEEARMILAALQFLAAAMNQPNAVPVENAEELASRLENSRLGWIPELSDVERAAAGYVYGYESEQQLELYFSTEAEQREASQLALLIESKREAIVYGLLGMWEEIRNEPNYDVRPGASDSFVVGGVLGNITGSQRIFMRERTKFPVVSVIGERPWRFGKIRMSGALDLSNLYMIDRELDRSDISSPHRTIMLLRLANNFVNGFAYHCIVRKERAEAVERQRVAGAESTHTSRADHSRHWVRPHFRKLPEGKNVSKGKEEEALERFGHLPPGTTFVSEHERQSVSLPPIARGFPKPFLKLDPELLIASL